MSDLTQLIQQWRDEGQRLYKLALEYGPEGIADGWWRLTRCADELQAALMASPVVPQTPQEPPTDLIRRLQIYEDALKSIAANSCCTPCHEAKLVAQKSLREAADALERR